MEKEYIDTVEEIHMIANKYIKLLAPPKATIKIQDSTHECTPKIPEGDHKLYVHCKYVSPFISYDIFTQGKKNIGHTRNKVRIDKYYYNCIYCDKYTSIINCKCLPGCIFCKPTGSIFSTMCTWILPGNSLFKEKEYIEAQKSILSDIERYQALYKKIDTIIRK